MAFFGLLGDGGGGGSTLDLYGDLFTPEQKKALQQREMTQGLFRMAEKLGAMAQPSRAPPGLGGTLGALGAGLGAFGGGTGEETALKGMEVAEKVRASQREREVLAKVTPIVETITKALIQQGVPAAQAVAQATRIASQVPPGSPAPSSNAPPPPLPAAPPVVPQNFGAAGEYGAGQAPSTLLPTPAAAPPPPPAGQQNTGLLGAPDQVVGPDGQPLPQGVLPQLAAMYGGRGPSPLPFRLASAASPTPGAAGAPFDAEWLRQNAPFPTVGRSGPQPPPGAAGAYSQGFTYGEPKVPLGQDPNDIAPRGGPSGPADETVQRPSTAIAARAPASSAGREARVKFWTDQGAPQHVAEGIADRVGAESSYRPDAIGDSGTSGGLYQHHADRLTRLKAYAADQGKPWTDPGVQDQFAATEVRGGDAIAARAWPAILAAPDRQTAAKLWDRNFERSAGGPGARGGRDTVIPSGPRLQRGDLMNVADTGAAPAGQGGGIAGTGVTAEALAALNAMLKLGGIKSDPFGSLLETYYKSPGYLGEKARTEAQATKDVGLVMDPKIAAETARQTQQYIQQNEEHKSGLELARDLIGKGVYLDQKTGRMEPITNAAQALAEIDRIKEQNKADLQLVDTTLTFPGETQPRTVQMTGAQARAIAEGRGVQIGGVNIPPMTGIKLGKPVPSEEDKAGIQARGAAQTEMYKAGQKALDTAHDAVRGANQRTPYYASMLTAMQGFQPGATKDAQLTAMQYLRDLGVIKGESVPQGEALRLAGERLAFLAVPPNQGSWSNIERQLLKTSIGGMSLTPEGLTDAIRMMQQLDDYDRKVSEIHRQVADKNNGLPNLLEAQRRVEALGPPLTAQQEAALQRLQQPAAAAVAAPQQAPATGTIQTPYGTITPVR